MAIRKRTWTTTGGETRTAWVADYFDPEKKRRRKTFATRKAADAWLIETRHDMTLGVHTVASTSITIAEAGEAWLTQSAADGLERSTLKNYRSHFTRHIKPLIGGIRLAEFSGPMVQVFHNKLIAAGHSQSLVGRVLVCLGALIADAMAAGKVGRNVVRDQGRAARRRSRIAKRHGKQLEIGEDIPTKAELNAMIEHARGRWRPFFLISIFTGLRVSEVRGLRWCDVDIKAATLTVRQRADHWNVIGVPKTQASRRSVPLAPLVVNALREWRLASPRTAADLVFPSATGGTLHHNTVHTALGRLQEAAGFTVTVHSYSRASRPSRHRFVTPRYSIHKLRHAAASLLIEQEVPPKRIQALLGHTSIRTTFDRYGHLFPNPERDQETMRQLQARLIGA